MGWCSWKEKGDISQAPGPDCSSPPSLLISQPRAPPSIKQGESCLFAKGAQADGPSHLSARSLPCPRPLGQPAEMPSSPGSHLLSTCYLQGPRPCVYICTEGLRRYQMSNCPVNLVLAISKQAIICRQTIHPTVCLVLIIPSLSSSQSMPHWLAKEHVLGHTLNTCLWAPRGLQETQERELRICLNLPVPPPPNPLQITQPGLEAIVFHGLSPSEMKTQLYHVMI